MLYFFRIGVAWKKCRNKIEKVAIILGVIFGVLATIFGAWTLYSYFGPGPPPPGSGSSITPFIPMSAKPNETNCTIIIGTPSTTKIEWNETWYYLVNISSDVTHVTHTNSLVNIPRTGTVIKGDIIKIAGGLHNTSEYQLSLVYNWTGGMMGTVSWTQ